MPKKPIWTRPIRSVGELLGAKQYGPVGRPPGALRKSEPQAQPAKIRALCYGPGGVVSSEDTLEEALARRGEAAVVWIDVVGPHDSQALRVLGQALDLHPLSLEDAQHLHQRPKFDEYEAHDYVALRLVHAEDTFSTEQISLFLAEGCVVTVQEHEADCFDEVRKRIKGGRHRITHSGPDYLLYALVDAVVDHSFPALERIGDRLETLEDRVLASPTEEVVADLHLIRRELLAFRKAVWPLRDALSLIYREERIRLLPQTQVFFRDAYDHAVQALDIIESFREMASSLLDLYLSAVSHRMNDTMKVLTIITTIFVPLGFLAGLYGMNFDPAQPGNMPELSRPYAYPMLLGTMGLLATAMLFGFWRIGWIGNRKPPEPKS